MSGRLDDAELDAALAAARAAWPGVEVAKEAFAAWLAARLPAGGALADLRASDLYLACACAQNDARAIALFDEVFGVEVDRALRRLTIGPSEIDETKQVLRRRFFVGEGTERRRIADYSGRGDLRSWVRAAAVRAALRVVRRPARQVDVDSSVMRAVAAPGDDLEIDYLKRRYANDFAQALGEAFAALDARDRNLVRYYYGEGLGIDAIGALYKVHRATAARRVRRVTDDLLAGTRKALAARLHADKREISSLVRLLESRLGAALGAVLATDPA